jgi:hypothetical protein
VIGLRLFIAALLVSCCFVMLGMAWWRSSQEVPGHVRAIGAQPGDYRPAPVADDGAEAPTLVGELEERCLEDTNYFGWAQTNHGGGATSVVSCWSGRPNVSRKIWAQSVAVR